MMCYSNVQNVSPDTLKLCWIFVCIGVHVASYVTSRRDIVKNLVMMVDAFWSIPSGLWDLSLILVCGYWTRSIVVHHRL
jgi:short subunit fatty acids transporter